MTENRSTEPKASVRIKLSSWEPPIGIEPMTYALRGTRSLTGHALAAALAWIIALTALAALGLSGMPFHEPFHARGFYPATVRKPHRRYSFGLVLGRPCQQFPSAGKHADAQGVLERLAANAGV